MKQKTKDNLFPSGHMYEYSIKVELLAVSNLLNFPNEVNKTTIFFEKNAKNSWF